MSRVVRDPALLKRAKKLRYAGYSYEYIRLELGVPWSTVQHWLRNTPKGTNPIAQRRHPSGGSRPVCSKGHALRRFDYITDGFGRVVECCPTCQKERDQWVRN